MFRSTSLIAGMLVLAACSPEQAADAPAAVATSTPDQAVRPVLAGSEYDPALALRGLDPQWTEAPSHTTTNYNPGLGLERFTTSWRNTSLVYDRTDDGGVYMIQTRSGLPGRCNSGPDLALAFDQFAHDLALGQAASQLRPRLIEAWASKDEWAEAEIGKVTVRAIGGCPRALVLKAL